MNCPKCGSKNIRMEDKFDEFTVYHCNKCNEYFKVDEPSTAEKLFWIAENFDIQIKDIRSIEVLVECRKNGRRIESFVGEYYEYKTIAEAINAAYEWAIKEEI